MGRLENILVTGANGFLGSHLLRKLIEKGYKPIAYLRHSSDIRRIESLQGRYVPFITAQNSEREIDELFKSNKIDAILHTATHYGRNSSLSDVINTNVVFPLTLIETGLKHHLKLFINTDTFFGKKEFLLDYLNEYTTSKRIFEGLLPNLASKLKIVNLRMEHIYGENDSESKFVTSILKQLIKGTERILLTEGVQKRDFIYIEDAVNAYISVLQHNDMLKDYNEFEVGTGQSISVKQFVEKIAELSSGEHLLNFGAIAPRNGEIPDSFANIKPLSELGWKVEYDLDTAIKRILKSEKTKYTYEN